ncbi:MAG: hypothetical protein K2Y14_13885 [Burkholderiales bacterium]|nr:hypothetical protein [Burkholderiales bacterium]
MADPLTLGIVAGVGALTGAASSIFGGYTQAGNYDAQGNALDQQSQMQKLQAQQIATNGTNKQNSQQQEAAKVAGQQRAAIGQSNLATTTGSMADVIDASGAKAMLDKYNIAYDTEIQSKSAIDQANMSSYQANVARGNAKNSVIGGYIGAAGSVLSGIGNYTSWSRIPTAK